jgi:hypothetical protein
MDFIEDTTRRNFVCRHVWHVSDLVLWNKRCTPIEACRSTLPAHDGQDRPHVATQDDWLPQCASRVFTCCMLVLTSAPGFCSSCAHNRGEELHVGAITTG